MRPRVGTDWVSQSHVAHTAICQLVAPDCALTVAAIISPWLISAQFPTAAWPLTSAADTWVRYVDNNNYSDVMCDVTLTVRHNIARSSV